MPIECKPSDSPSLPPRKQATTSPPVFESAQLFGVAVEVLIRHAGREYRLRRTRLGKLILTA